MKIKAFRTYAGAVGTDIATAIVRPEEGVFHCKQLAFFSDAIGTFKVHIGSVSDLVNAAVAASTTCVINTNSAGDVKGYTPTTSDGIIIESDSGGYLFRQISAVASVSSATVSLTLDAAVTCSANDTFWIVKAADILSRTTTADERVTELRDSFSSNHRAPVAVEVSATGVNELSLSGMVYTI